MSKGTVNDRWHKIDKASGEKVRSKNYGVRGRWQVRYYVGGDQKSEVFDTKGEADNRLDEIVTQRRTGSYSDPRLGKVTVETVAAKWLEAKVRPTRKTMDRYRQILDFHILPTWGRTRVADIRPTDVAAWVGRLCRQQVADPRRTATLSPATVHKIVTVFSQIMDFARRDGRISSNPCEKVELPALTPSNRRYLTHAKLDELARRAAEPSPKAHLTERQRAARDQYRLMVLTFGLCGLRYGELIALRVSSLDAKRTKGVRFQVDQAVTEVGSELVWGLPKGRKVRSVPVPSDLATELVEFIARTGKTRDDLLFGGLQSGKPMRNRAFRRGGFDRAAKAMIDQDGDSLTGFTPHELRHTAASLAIASGADLKSVQNMLGHSSLTMTGDLYGHLVDDRLDEVAQRMDADRQRALAATGEEQMRNDAQVIKLHECGRKAVGQ